MELACLRILAPKVVQLALKIAESRNGAKDLRMIAFEPCNELATLGLASFQDYEHWILQM